MSKVIKAVFTGRFCTTRRVFQYDTDDKLQIVNLDLPQNYTVDFANSLTGTSVSVLAASDTVQIPPDMFVPGSEIYAWVWISDTNGGHTKCQTTIPVDPRAQRSGTSPAPAQASAWDDAVDALNEAAADYETAISHAPIIQNGYWYIWDSTAGEYVTTDVKAEGVDGAGVWYTTDLISGNENPFVRRRSLIGREGATVQVHDLLFAPDVGYDGAPTTLYEITSVGIACSLNRLCKMQGAPGEPGEDGAPGQNGTDGADGQDGQDGYSPEVTITEITGGHRVTITDEEHPSGQSFDVMDGTGSSITVDSALSDSSENPVQNKVIKAALDTKGTYSKPSGGIPKTDLASAVQTSLGKADTALQPGDVTEPLVATYTIDSLPDGRPVSATCDKTFSELATAMYAGTSIVCLVKYGAFPLAITGNVTNDLGSSINASVVFSRDMFGSIVHNSDDTCTVDVGVFANGSIVAGTDAPVSGDTVYNALLGKLDINQGSSNAGKVLKVGNDGTVAPAASIEPLIVTYTASDMSSGGTTCDKTYNEITAAAMGGQQIIACVIFQNQPLGLFSTMVGDNLTGALCFSGIVNTSIGLACWSVTHAMDNTCVTGITFLNGGGAVESVNGHIGAVVLTASDVGAVAVAQGVAHAGEFLVVGSNGNVTTKVQTEEVTVSTDGAVTQALDAGKIYHFTGALTSLTITLNAAGSGQLAQYHFDFDCGSTAPTVTIPNAVAMPSGNSFDANKHYEVDILNNYGAVMAWANS